MYHDMDMAFFVSGLFTIFVVGINRNIETRPPRPVESIIRVPSSPGAPDRK